MLSLRRADFGRGITRSAAFRLTLRFVATFVACLLLADVVVGMSTRWVVRRQEVASVEDTLGGLQAAEANGGIVAVSEAISARENDDEEYGQMLGLQDAGGSPLAGDLTLPAPREGWSEFVPPGADTDEAFWVKSARLSDGSWISVGASTERYHDIAEDMVAGAVWSVATALPLALICGALLSRAVLGRLAQIATIAEGVRDGSLSRRAPVSDRDDEFDRLAGDLNAMLDTTEALTRNLRNVTVGIAHELRGPLARIRHRLEEVRQSHPTAAIDASVAEIDTTLATFDALLKIGEIEAKARLRDSQLIDFSALVAELAEVYAPVAAEQGKLVDARVAAGVELRGDRSLLTQMISNLLENAIEHTPHGTHITVELTATGADQKLIVQDDGLGIPAADRDRIFDRFYRIDRSVSSRGTGLGLSLVRSICGLHGFTVRLEPTLSGARFEVSVGKSGR